MSPCTGKLGTVWARQKFFFTYTVVSVQVLSSPRFEAVACFVPDYPVHSHKYRNKIYNFFILYFVFVFQGTQITGYPVPSKYC